MGLNSSSVASALNAKLDDYIKSEPTTDNRIFLDYLQAELDKGFQQASVSMQNVDISTVAGSLFIPFTDVYNMSKDIATACTQYWVQAITPGIPQGCEAIVSVSNDASKIYSPIFNGLEAIAEKHEISEPYFQDMVDVIFNQVKTIMWIVVEASPKCSTTFTVTIS